MISIIVAASEDGVIGHLKKIPWYLPRDLAYFAATTKGHTVIMGRTTYESIIARLGTPLPRRKNIVATKQRDFVAPGCAVITDAQRFLKEHTDTPEEVFVIGGAQLYRLALPYAKKIYQTIVHKIVEGDTLFPEFDISQWNTLQSQHFEADERNESATTFIIYERKRQQ